ncbi:uncharacterized protein LOC131943842 [Physella acuta]|uniref:uncharacterized protein LOC131943842 n=1 Tax=Physella acuta TaxID=109671 RepID=UPI0027DB8421|nr:uncharacterized protein LOC131943842 [Physella acuta]
MDSVGFYLLLNLLLTLTFVAVDSTKLEDKNKDRHKAEKDVLCSSTNLYYNESITQDPFIVVHSTPCFMDKDKTRSVTFFICDSNCINCNRHCIVNTAKCKDDENMICYCQKNSENGNVLITVKVPIPDTDQCLLGQMYNNTSLLNITKLLKVENDSISPGKDEKDTTEGSTSPGKDEKDMTESK